jgi:hypothetical protein
MQKPKFKTVEKSAWLYVTTRLHPKKAANMSRRAAIRCGYLATAGNLLETESILPTPHAGEAMSDYRARIKSAG